MNDWNYLEEWGIRMDLIQDSADVKSLKKLQKAFNSEITDMIIFLVTEESDEIG